jgi:hypothetical protein
MCCLGSSAAPHVCYGVRDWRVSGDNGEPRWLPVRFLGEGQPPLPILSPRVVDALNVRIDWETRETSIFGFSL